MARLAIKGHAARGIEVIALLEMLGGNNIYNLTGTKEIWYILSNGVIEHSAYLFNEKGFTLEEFLEKFPYKVGDKVTHNMGILMTVVHMYWDAECNVIRYDIQSPVDNNYKLKAMLAEHLQPYKEETMEEKETFREDDGTLVGIDLTRELRVADEVEVILGNYEFVLKGGKTYFVKKNKYPKTYEKCCEVLGIEEDLWFVYEDIDGNHINPACISNYRIRNLDLYHNLEKLLICRDAYWKIAGELMGLGKPWKPDWTKEDERKYCIANTEGNIVKWVQKTTNKNLAFSTEEMRDAFFENFKELIEQCKELL